MLPLRSIVVSSQQHVCKSHTHGADIILCPLRDLLYPSLSTRTQRTNQIALNAVALLARFHLGWISALFRVGTLPQYYGELISRQVFTYSMVCKTGTILPITIKDFTLDELLFCVWCLWLGKWIKQRRGRSSQRRAG